MRNTRRIIEAIISHTNFNPTFKAGLEALYENNVDIIYWNALNEAEDASVEKKINSAFDKLKSSLKSEIVKPVEVPKYNNWISNKKTEIEKTAKEEIKKEDEEKGHSATKPYIPEKNPFATIDKDMGIGLKTGYRDEAGIDILTTKEDAEAKHFDRVRRSMTAYKNAYYELINAEQKVGIENIRAYVEKISDDVQTFVNLITLLINQIIKEAWVNSPETIKKAYGDNLVNLYEGVIKGIRMGNVNEFIKESATLLQLAQDLSIYLLLGNIKKDVNTSVLDIWDDAQKKSKEKTNSTPLSRRAKDIFVSLGEDVNSGFYKELQESIWDSIPSIIEKHGDRFFLIIESTSDVQFDAFMSSGLRKYHPLFETMYEELSNKKPFNWLFELEDKLFNNIDVEKAKQSLSYCASTLVEQGISKGLDYTFPIIGINSGIFAYNLLSVEHRKKEEGLSKLFGIEESLWITSSYVPGMYGLIFLLMNIASGVLFVAYAEDMIPFDMSKAHPDFTNLPIWKAFREGSLDIRGSYKPDVDDEPKSSDKIRNKNQIKGGLIKKYFVK